jgi:pimeloyl-ACP methyl ester carboxylesterase
VLSTYVLLHGNAHGGWCYKTVGGILRTRGHTVFTPTLTGFGERSHIDGVFPMDTYVRDVANVLEYEDLQDVILVGHSQGGIVIPHVALRAPERIRRVVWMTALVFTDGERASDHDPAAWSPWLAEAFAAIQRGAPEQEISDLLMDAFLQDGTEEQRAWVKARLAGNAEAIHAEPAQLSAFLELGLPTGYIFATRDQSLPLPVQQSFAERLPGCRTASVEASHDLMIAAPEATAAALELMAVLDAESGASASTVTERV